MPTPTKSQKSEIKESPGGPGTIDENVPHPVHDWSDRNAREKMIAEAAYFKAEQRGFAVGVDLLDWLKAEEELIRHFEGGEHTD